MRYVRFVMAVLLIPLARLKAQGAPVLEPGVRVRVSTAPRPSSPNWIVGTVIAVTGDRLAIRPQQDSGGTIDIARTAVTHLEVSRGQHSKALTGLGLGFLVGAGVGAVIGVGGEDLAPTDAKLIGAGFGAVGGALIGLVIGSGSKSERWQEVPVTLGGMGGAQGFGYSIRVSVNLRFRTQ
jgi:hypothetical protein